MKLRFWTQLPNTKKLRLARFEARSCRSRFAETVKSSVAPAKIMSTELISVIKFQEATVNEFFFNVGFKII